MCNVFGQIQWFDICMVRNTQCVQRCRGGGMSSPLSGLHSKLHWERLRTYTIWFNPLSGGQLSTRIVWASAVTEEDTFLVKMSSLWLVSVNTDSDVHQTLPYRFSTFTGLDLTTTASLVCQQANIGLSKYTVDRYANIKLQRLHVTYLPIFFSVLGL